MKNIYKTFIIVLLFNCIACGQKMQFETVYQATLSEFDKVDKIIESIRKDSIDYDLKMDTLVTYIDSMIYKAESLNRTYNEYECKYYFGEFTSFKSKIDWTLKNMKSVSASYTKGDVYYWDLLLSLSSVKNEVESCKHHCNELNEMYLKDCH